MEDKSVAVLSKLKKQVGFAIAVGIGVAFTVSTPALATECELLFYDLGATKDGKAGSSETIVCEKLKSEISGQTLDRFRGEVSAKFVEELDNGHCLVTTDPGELPIDLLDFYRFRVGNIVSRVAGEDYTNWNMVCR